MNNTNMFQCNICLRFCQELQETTYKTSLPPKILNVIYDNYKYFVLKDHKKSQ